MSNKPLGASPKALSDEAVLLLNLLEAEAGRTGRNAIYDETTDSYLELIDPDEIAPTPVYAPEQSAEQSSTIDAELKQALITLEMLNSQLQGTCCPTSKGDEALHSDNSSEIEAALSGLKQLTEQRIRELLSAKEVG